MDFKEKAIVRLDHWIHHNEHHHEEYELFAEQLEEAGKKESAKHIREMMKYTLNCKKRKKKALEDLD